MHTQDSATLRRFASLLTVGVAALVFATALPSPAAAAGVATSVSLDEQTVARGYTVSLDEKAVQLAVNPGVVTQPAVLALQEDDSLDDVAAPAGYERVSPIYSFNLQTAERPNFGLGLVVAIRSQEDSLYLKRVFFYDRTQQAWRPLTSRSEPEAPTVRAHAHFPYAQVALFSNHGTLEGKASWYRSSRYPDGVASNDFPLGSKLRVTNLENQKSTTVRVVSTGPFVRGRVVDLVSTAFKEIASTSDGVISVRVEPISSPARATTSVSITAPIGYAYQTTSGETLFEKSADREWPLASITKLMTALVVLDQNPLLTGTVTIDASDTPTPETGVTIQVVAGQEISVKDLFYGTLTGSANNAALALARSTGLSRADFVSAMNAKAAALGLTTLTFADPSGLDTRNTGTARDIARLIALALDNSIVRSATGRRTVSYLIKTTDERRTIRNPLFIGTTVLSEDPLIGAKTGYINESHYNIALGAAYESGHVIVVVFGAATRVQRNTDAQRILHAVAP